MSFPDRVKDCWDRYDPDKPHDIDLCPDCQASWELFKGLVKMNALLRDLEQIAAQHGFVIGRSRNLVGQLSYEATSGENFYDKLGWIESSICE